MTLLPLGGTHVLKINEDTKAECAELLGIPADEIHIVNEGEDIEFVEYNAKFGDARDTTYAVTDGTTRFNHDPDNPNVEPNSERFGEFHTVAHNATYVAIIGVIYPEPGSINFSQKQMVLQQIIVVEDTALAVVQEALEESGVTIAA